MEEVKKRCTICNRGKTLRLFYRHPAMSDGRQSICVSCHKSRSNQYYRARRQAGEGYAGKGLWLSAVRCLGGYCIRCGESDISVLELDHIHDDGKKHRSEMHAYEIYGWAVSDPYANKRLQVLCRNCNRLKVINRQKYDAGCVDRLLMAACP